MKRILKHSVTLDEFRTNMERYMSLWKQKIKHVSN
jgi:hypothetical protein